jgi:uncharacterized protein (DUF362 family)
VMGPDNQQLVAVTRVEEPRYPSACPYHPAILYPEYPFPGSLSAVPNHVYGGVRRLFSALGLDREREGSPEWNPLGRLIQPGMCVVLKPNFVLSRHKQGKDLFSIITHPSVLRVVADYCWIALKGTGRIIIADAPQYDCDYSELLAATQLDRMVRFYREFHGTTVEHRDLRLYWSPGRHFASMLQALPGDPAGSAKINLGSRSALFAKQHPEKLYGAVYHRSETIAHHIGDLHEYQVSRTVLDADVIISVPKLKVHKKVGVTLNAKGLVGIATNKNLIVHYTLTPPRDGGDQYPDGLFNPMEESILRLERWMYDHLLAPRRKPLEYLHRTVYWLHNHSTRKLGLKVNESKRQLDAGNWYGNDSAWRMTVDLMNIIHFADSQGNLAPQPRRRTFSIIDGVIGGENCGPLTPDPKPAGVLLGGENLLAVDVVAARLMGFDPLKLKLYAALLNDSEWGFGVRDLRGIQVVSEQAEWRECLENPSNPYLGFRPHPGWRGQIEAGAQVAQHV